MTDIKKLTKKGEEEQLAPVPSSGVVNFKLEDVVSKLKSFYIDEIGYLVGSVVVHGQGRDVDIALHDSGLSDHLKEAIEFRLYRQFSGLFNIPYDEVTEYCHLHWSPHPYTDHVPIYRLKVEKVENGDIVRMSKLTILRKSDDKRIIAGYASVIAIDLENNIVTKEALEKALKRFMEEDKYRNVMYEHEAVPIGRVIESYDGHTTHVDDNGLYIVVEVRDDLNIANKIWRDIEDGNLDGFSIHGEVLVSHEQNGIEVVDDLNLYEISVCKSPVNVYSRFKVLK